MSPAQKKRTAETEWRPTALQLALLRDLNFAPGDVAWAELARALGARAQSAGASPTVKSLVAHGFVLVRKGERLWLTGPGNAYVSGVCLRRGRHTPTKGAPERCAECGARLVENGDVRRLLAHVRMVRAELGQLGTATELGGTLARRLGRQSDAALLAQARGQLGATLLTLDVVVDLAERGARGAASSAVMETSLAVAVACSGRGALVGLVERDVERLVESGWEVVSGPRPWRARSVTTSQEVVADSLGALVERARAQKGGES